SEKLLKCLPGRILPYDHTVRETHHADDVGEILARIIARLLKVGRDQHRGNGCADGISVRPCGHNRVGADYSTASGDILDNYRLSEISLCRLGECSGGDVIGASGAKRNDDTDRSVREVLCGDAVDGRRQHEAHKREGHFREEHAVFPSILPLGGARKARMVEITPMAT